MDNEILLLSPFLVSTDVRINRYIYSTGYGTLIRIIRICLHNSKGKEQVKRA